jgi:two-component system response regulator HydG
MGTMAAAASPRPAATVPGLYGSSPHALRLKEQIHKYACSSAAVLVTGETGTGKELAARAVHQLSVRRDGPFVPINSSAVTPEIFESEFFGHERGAFTGACTRRVGKIASAAGGTLFLDEIGDLPPAQQAKLLRVLQDGEFFPVGSDKPVRADFRLVSATNKNLRAGLQAGWFREDLYYRISTLCIEVPPLRDRLDDIAELVQALSDVAELHSDRELVAVLRRHSWPGNIRELVNILEAVRCEVAWGEEPARAATAAIQRSQPANAAARCVLAHSHSMAEIQRANAEAALRETDGNITRAATEKLGMSRYGLVGLMDRMGIERHEAWGQRKAGTGKPTLDSHHAVGKNSS